MAENKKSFVLYADLLRSIDHLTNEEKGILFNHLLEYVNDKNPVLTDRIILTAWKPIELQLKRDLHEWEVIKVDRSKSGVLGNLKRWNLDLYDKVVSNEISLQDAENIAKHRKTSHTDNKGRNGSHGVANIAVTVTDTVTDNVTVTENGIRDAPHFLNPEIADQVTQLTIAQCRERYDKECQVQKESIGMNLRIKLDQLKPLQDSFDAKLKSKSTTKTFQDYTNHFANWVNKLPMDELNRVVSNQPTSGTQGKRIVSHLGYK